MDNGASSYRRFLDGDDEGIVEIVRDYKDGLILYLNSFTENIGTAEELMEETFVKLATRKPVFRGRSAFKTWLYAIGRNVALDHLRHSARLSLMSGEELERLAGEEESLERSYLRTQAVVQHLIIGVVHGHVNGSKYQAVLCPPGGDIAGV